MYDLYTAYWAFVSFYPIMITLFGVKAVFEVEKETPNHLYVIVFIILLFCLPVIIFIGGKA